MKITLRSIAVLAMFFTPALAAHATPAFVQQNYATPQTPQSIVAVTYTKAQVASDTNVVVVGWNDTAANVVSIADSKGNNYALALPTYRGNGMSQAIYYAPSIAAAAVGTNTVTVTFDRPAVYADIRIAEYSGLNGPSMDGTSSGTGSARTASSGLIQTTANGDLLVGAGVTSYAFSAAGSGYTKRVITLPDTDILEDRISGSPGAYSATAIDNDLWVMQIAAFKVGSGAPDTTPPSVPANLHATGITNSSIALAWDPSTDNVGVAGYKLYRDGLQ
ncbi:MAG TPA: fibronectin type III domain-containing protein, partial [Candidatus Paceibacterota bacterium]|nr:fibronectin type III domain-containing protein [Candidatus Paceibacterota bacterium]